MDNADKNEEDDEEEAAESKREQKLRLTNYLEHQCNHLNDYFGQNAEQTSILDDSSMLFAESDQHDRIRNDNHQRIRKLKEFSKLHIKSIVDDQILQGKIDREKWGANLHKFVLKAVDSVKPSSRYLDDGMDFNKFVDI